MISKYFNHIPFSFVDSGFADLELSDSALILCGPKAGIVLGAECFLVADSLLVHD